MTGSNRARRGRWPAALLALAAPVVALALGGCSSSGDCGEPYSRAILAVDGVASTDVDCSEQLGGGWQRVGVHLETLDEQEARSAVEQVLRAVAAEPDIKDVWATPQHYYLEDGSELADPRQGLGFNGVPDVGDVREHYGITG
ncbi:hypothetical protein [Oerskovia flava]|uniref:hypothetical protein n=1 Tax=Oerskovia flava TaxID=2986422 RepID=UPI00223ECD79|nr:hypothetical protein [Oerskovia sp. JB1-3-2]